MENVVVIPVSSMIVSVKIFVGWVWERVGLPRMWTVSDVCPHYFHNVAP